MRKRQFLKAAAVSVGAATLGAGRSVFGSNLTRIRVAWQPTSQTVAYLYARASGVFRDAGLEIEHFRFSAGPPMFAAVRSESVDVLFIAETGATVLLSQEIPAKVVSFAADYGGAMALIAGKDSGINKVSDLRGKKVAIVRGSAAHFTLGALLRQEGMTFDDVQLMSVDITNLIPAFVNGDVQAALYWEPWMNRLVQSGGRVVVTNRQAQQPSATMWLARTKWIEQNASSLTAFLRAMDSVVSDIGQTPGKVAATVSQELGIDAVTLAKILEQGVYYPTIRESLDPSYTYSIAPSAVAAGKGLASVLKDVAVFMKDAGVIRRVPDVTKVFSTGAAEKAVAG